MTGLIDTVLAGILLGGIYALFALGLSLIFGIMRLVNLAHGDLILLAAYLVLTATTALGVPLPVATVLVIVAMFILGFILQRLVLERLLGRRHSAAPARHLRAVDHHSKRIVAGVRRRQPQASGRRLRSLRRSRSRPASASAWRRWRH